MPGRSPLAPEQPVLTYPPIARKAFAGDPINVTTSRPTSTSEAEPGHAGPQANDGQDTTGWRASAKDGTAFWSVHLENVYAHWLSLVLPDDRGPDFVVEVSKDALDWREVAQAKGGRRTYGIALFEHPSPAAFLRIRFPSVTADRPAALSEVQVFAKPAN